VALPFVVSDAGLLAVQAGVVAAPRAVAAPAWITRFRGRGWAIVPVASIVGVIFLIRYASSSAIWLTWLALIAIPVLAAVALGWAARGARPPLAVVAIGLFALVWRSPHSLAGEAAEAILAGLSCVTLGVILGSVTPHSWLKAGIIAMAAADVWLVSAQLLQHPNSELAAAAPGGGLPQLQSEQFGSITMGYGDLFVAGLLGAIYASNRRLQLAAAVLTLAIAGAFDLLFFFVNDLPATVPVALALLVLEIRPLRRWLTGAGLARGAPHAGSPHAAESGAGHAAPSPGHTARASGP
jgi:hypothetical protein